MCVSPLFLFVLVFVFVLWAAGSETEAMREIMKLCASKQELNVPLTYMDCIVVRTNGNQQAEMTHVMLR